MIANAMQRGADRIAELADQGHDLITFLRDAGEIVGRTIAPHFFAPCFFTLDPASLLATSHFSNAIDEIPHAWLAHEYSIDDCNQMRDIARSATGVSTLDDAAGEELQRSERYQNLSAWGADQELRCALRTASGQVWGFVGLYREPGMPKFNQEEIEFLQAVSAPLAEGARRALLIGEATDPDAPDAPGLLVLREDWSVESITPGVDRWLDELPDGDWTNACELPTAVMAVAGQAKRTALDNDPGEVAFARVLSRSGHWLALHGASMVSAGPGRVAVIIEPVQPARLAPLLMAAYKLTAREQDVTQLVLQGNSTNEIAEQLVVSSHTVTDHIKNVFEKTGVRSRRDLISKVFFSFYEPRIRDNERRATSDKPARGGPLN